jgi:hypothetical protein
MGGGPDNVKDACISELANYALTVARLPTSLSWWRKLRRPRHAGEGRISGATLGLPVVAPETRDHRSESCDSVHHCIFPGRTGRAYDAKANCHACAALPIARA